MIAVSSYKNLAMDTITEHSKVFKSAGAIMLVLPFTIGPIFFIKVLMIIYHTPMSVELVMLVLLELLILFCLLASLQSATTQIYVTKNKVVSKDIFGEKAFPLGSIKVVKRVNRGGRTPYSAILIEMDDSTSEIIGSALTKKEEICSYILRQIQIHYPEKYDSIKSKSFYDPDKIY